MAYSIAGVGQTGLNSVGQRVRKKCSGTSQKTMGTDQPIVHRQPGLENLARGEPAKIQMLSGVSFIRKSTDPFKGSPD